MVWDELYQVVWIELYSKFTMYEYVIAIDLCIYLEINLQSMQK